MADDFVQKTDHEHSISRVHDRIDKMVESSIRMEESSKRIEKFSADMHSIIYGNGKPGLITQVSNLFTVLKVHKALMLMIVSGILGIAFWIMRGQ